MWERNLYVLWVAQAMAAIGFSFFFPFVPLFVQELGVPNPTDAVLWTGIAGGVSGLVMMVSGPFWGAIGDRYGRKRNVLRAMFGSALTLGLTALATDVSQLLILRVVLGLVSGTWVTVMALGSSMAPREKHTFCIGVIQSATFFGFALGPLVGGMLAEQFGFREAFFITSLMLTFSGLLVFLFVIEEAERPIGRDMLGTGLIIAGLKGVRDLRVKGIGAMLGVLILIQIGPTMMMPTLPVFVGVLSGYDQAAMNAGVAFSIIGLMGIASSLVMARLTRSIGILSALVGSMIGAGIMYLPLVFATELKHVYLSVAVIGFFNGGLNTLVFALIGKSASPEKQGAVYGVAQSASALAWAAGPLAGGMIAGAYGLREVFFVNAAVLLVMTVFVAKLLGSRQELRTPNIVPSAAV